MQMTARKAVDPIIASLLLIAITVAAGIIVYVYVNSLAGGLTQSGGQQTTEQLSMDSNAFNTASQANKIFITVRNTGAATVSVDQVFLDGTVLTTATTPDFGGTCQSSPTVTVGSTCTIVIGGVHAVPAGSEVAGTSHLVKCVTVTGGTFVFSVAAGRSG